MKIVGRLSKKNHSTNELPNTQGADGEQQIILKEKENNLACENEGLKMESRSKEEKEDLIEKYAKGEGYYSELDPLFEEAARLIVIHQQGSTSLIQRKFSIGYNRAGRIVDQLESAGIIAPLEGGCMIRSVLFKNEIDLERILKI